MVNTTDTSPLSNSPFPTYQPSPTGERRYYEAPALTPAPAPHSTSKINNKVEKIYTKVQETIQEYNDCVGTPAECEKAKKLTKTLGTSRDKLQDLKKNSSPGVVDQLNEAAASLREILSSLDVMKSTQEYCAVALRTQETYRKTIANFIYEQVSVVSSYASSAYSSVINYFNFTKQSS